jgi:hypothetical protein
MLRSSLLHIQIVQLYRLGYRDTTYPVIYTYTYGDPSRVYYVLTKRIMLVIALVPAAKLRVHSLNESDNLQKSHDLLHKNTCIFLQSMKKDAVVMPYFSGVTYNPPYRREHIEKTLYLANFYTANHRRVAIYDHRAILFR